MHDRRFLPLAVLAAVSALLPTPRPIHGQAPPEGRPSWSRPDPLPHLGHWQTRSDGWRYLRLASDPLAAKVAGLRDDQQQAMAKRFTQAVDKEQQLRKEQYAAGTTDQHAGARQRDRLWQFEADAARKELAPAQQAQLKQLDFQRLGFAALERDDVAALLGLSHPQRLEIANLCVNSGAETESLDRQIAERLQRLGTGLSGQQFSELLAELTKLNESRAALEASARDKTWKHLQSLLTPAQEKAFDALRGPSMPPVAESVAAAAAQQRESRLAADQKEPWHDANYGLQYRIRAEELAVPEGISPLLFVDLRNRGERVDLAVSTIGGFHSITVDHAQYRKQGIGGSSELLNPGDDPLTIPFVLSPDWKSVQNPNLPLRLLPGKHGVSVTLTISPAARMRVTRDGANYSFPPRGTHRDLETAELTLDVGSRQPNPQEFGVVVDKVRMPGVENLRRELVAATRFHTPDVAPHARETVLALQPHAGNYLVQVLNGEDASLHWPAATTFAACWDSMNREQIERYLESIFSHFAWIRPQYPQGVEARITVGTRKRFEQYGLPQHQDIKIKATNSHFVDGKPIDKPHPYGGIGAVTHNFKTADFEPGRHTIRITTEYELTQKGATYTGKKESPEFVFEIVAAGAPDDLVAPKDELIDKMVHKYFRIENTEEDLRQPVGAAQQAFRGRQPGMDEHNDPWQPQVQWHDPLGRGKSLHTPVWKVEAPLPVDLCFDVEFHIDNTDVVIPGDEIFASPNHQTSGYFTVADLEPALEVLRQHADTDGFVPVKIVLKPSRAVALSHPHVHRYYGGELVCLPLRVKVSP